MPGIETVAVDVLTERAVWLMRELPALVAKDADLIRRGRFLTVDFEIGIGDVPLLVHVVNGGVTGVERGPFLLKPWTFAIRSAPDTWLKFLEPVPAPGWHDIMALSKRGAARIEGDLQPFMANLQYVKDVLSAPRTLTTKG